MDIASGVDIQQLFLRHEEVRRLVSWWISRPGNYRRVLRTRDTVKDFHQDVWVRLLQSFSKGRRVNCRLSSVIVKTCEWEVADPTKLLRAPLRWKLREARPPLPEDRVTDEDEALEAYAAKELRRVVMRALRWLPRNQCFVLIYRLGLSQQPMLSSQELAQVLGCSRRTVRKLEALGVQRLSVSPYPRMLSPYAAGS